MNVDPTDMYDIDRQVWREEQEAERRLEEERLLTDGRQVTPMTVAEYCAWVGTQRAREWTDPRYTEALSAPYDHTSDYEPGAA